MHLLLVQLFSNIHHNTVITVCLHPEKGAAIYSNENSSHSGCHGDLMAWSYLKYAYLIYPHSLN
jgi:hypothetical protein